MEQETKPCIRVAAYCRVSTMLEEQDGSYETQMEYYKAKITADPQMILVGIYGDKGKSGLKTKGRNGLNRLMADCEAGKIDLILTKSVSRFTRNMADFVELVHRLHSKGITVVFEREGIRTDDYRCELILNIFAALAQEESNSISQNARKSHEEHAAEGKPLGRATYGYISSGPDRWKINLEEAKRVRIAFNMIAKGRNYQDVLYALNSLERKQNTGLIWQQRRVRRMLRNVVYIGDFYSHGTVCMTPGHQVVNRGYRDRYYIEEHHQPIVSRNVFDRVQFLMDHKIPQSYINMSPEREKIINETSWKDR